MQLSSSGTEQCSSSSFSSRPRTAHCMQEPSPAHPISTEPAPHSQPQHKAPPPAMAAPTTHTQASTGCSLLRGFWMDMDIKAFLFKTSTFPCICSNLPRTSQRSHSSAAVGRCWHSQTQLVPQNTGIHFQVMGVT